MGFDWKKFVRAVLVAALVLLGAPFVAGLLGMIPSFALGSVDTTLLIVAGLLVLVGEMLVEKLKFLK